MKLILYRRSAVVKCATIHSSIALCTIALSACTFTMVGNAPKVESSIAQTKTINASFAKTEQFENLCSDPDQDLAEIRFQTNPAYVLASIVTLGLYSPQHVTWWCGEEEPECEDDDDSEECEVYIPEGNG